MKRASAVGLSAAIVFTLGVTASASALPTKQSNAGDSISQGFDANDHPSDQPQDFALDIGAALALPAQESRSWRATPAFDKTAARRAFAAGHPAVVHLAPFQVLVWELSPTH